MPVFSPSNTSSLLSLTEQDLRKEIDRSVSRAMFDGEFARHLLADPTMVLNNRGCTPQQYLDLRSIRATTIFDFARQAQALFWPTPVSLYPADDAALKAAAI